MTILAKTHLRDRVLSGHGTLMGQCLEAGLPVASSCSGRGACARCAVSILHGLSALSRPGTHESLVLARNGCPGDVRLSCQCRVLNRAAQVVITTGYW
jgi:ferredoxin